MIIRLALVLVISVVALADQCPGNTFDCGDGCIPEDWKCDGAPDCNNGADESADICSSSDAQVETVITQAETQSVTTQRSTSTDSSSTVAENIYSENEDSVTSDYESSTTTDSTLRIPVCTESKRQIVETCYEKIGAWVEKLGQVDLNLGLFTATEQLAKIEASCSVYQEFKSCLGDLYQNPSGCILPEALDSWDRYETYTCQLLLPSASEHADCFQKIDNTSCIIQHYNIRPSNTMANFCNPIFSVKRVLDCAPFVQDSCSQDSQDFLAAIRSETAVSDSLYACADTVEIAGTFSRCPSDLFKCKSELAGVDVGEITGLLGSTSEMLENGCQAYVRYRGCMADKIGTKDSCWPTDEAFRYMDAVFSTYCSSDIMEGISSHSTCLTNVMTNSDLFICKADTIASAKGELSTCRAMQNLLAFLKCGQGIVATECDSPAESFVDMVHGRLSDQLISFNCDYSTLAATTPASKYETEAQKFSLATSVYPACSTSEETGALSCLLGLFELQQIFGDFRTQNIFIELANKDSVLISKACSVYSDYESCLDDQVFTNRGGRCSFSANINKMARIGLGPLCDNATRENIQKHRGCMQKLQESGEVNQCGSHINRLGGLVMELIQGGSDYTLCKVFYLIRELFICIEPFISETCGDDPLEATHQAKQLITDYGVEEGCPAIKPIDYDRYASLVSVKQVPDVSDYDYETGTTPAQCMTAEYAEFNFCLRPLGSFKPNALSVIANPRKIDQACEAYEKYRECRETVSCKPRWSAGIVRMFEFVCDDQKGKSLYADAKKCLRRLSQRSDMKECIQHFTEFANVGDSCAVANRFLSCSYSSVLSRCGAEAARFVSIFIMRFALGTDMGCIIKFSTTGLNGTATVAENVPQARPIPQHPFRVISPELQEPTRPPIASMLQCSDSETTKIEQCQQIMFSTVDRIKELFNGGIGAFISNMNLLADIFADGCEKSATFQECAKISMDSGSSCAIGSCIIKAGEGICDQEDRKAVIKTHLNCVFSLISEPDFGKCIRSTFTGANLSGLNLELLKELVPKFVNCAAGVIERKCGQVPVNILRSVGSEPEQCILDLSDIGITTEIVPQAEDSADSGTTASEVSSASSGSSEYIDVTTVKASTEDQMTTSEAAAPETSAEPHAEPTTEPAAASTTSEVEPVAEGADSISTMMSMTEKSTVMSTMESMTEKSTVMSTMESMTEKSTVMSAMESMTEKSTVMSTMKSMTEKSTMSADSEGMSTDSMESGIATTGAESANVEPSTTAEGFVTTTGDGGYVEAETTAEAGIAEPETSSETAYGDYYSTLVPFSEVDYSEQTESAETEPTTEPHAEPETTATTARPMVKTTPPKKPHPPVPARQRPPGNSGQMSQLSRISWVSSVLCWFAGLVFLNQGLRL